MQVSDENFHFRVSPAALRTEPFFWSRLGFCYDPPRYNSNGTQLIFSDDFPSYRRFHDQFTDCGVRNHTVILPTGWNGDGRFDYRLTDRVLHALLDGNSQIQVLPRIKLNVPIDWCRNHPAEVFVYEGGPQSEREIAALVDTPAQDILGYDSAAGYGVNGGRIAFRDDRPNVGGRIALQSISSQVWLRDAADAIRRLIAHIAETPFARQIVGYHIAYGNCGESTVWGGWNRPGSGRFGDFGISHTRHFIAFARARYGSEAALRAAWQQPDGPLGVPSTARRSARGSLAEFCFASDAACRDYYDFLSDANARAAAALCRAVKQADPALIAGVFYGYSYLPTAAECGHLAAARLLESPDVDFLASPKGYYRAQAGQPGGEQGPSQSYNRKKAWMDEIDNRTFLDRRADTQTRTLAQSVTLLQREAVKNLTYGQGFWWMDLGDGWYDHPVLMQTIADLTALAAQVNRLPHRSTAEILLITDEVGDRMHAPSMGLAGGLHMHLHAEMHLCGAPVDTARLADLAEMPLDQYRLIVVDGLCALSESKFAAIRARTRPDAQLIVHYAFGALDESGQFDIDRVRRMTGIAIRENPAAYPVESFGYRMTDFPYNGYTLLHDFPLIEIVPDPALRVLARYPDGRVMTAQCGAITLCAFPSLTAAQLHERARAAGCTMIAPPGFTVYADNRILGIFPPDGDAPARISIRPQCRN